MPPVITNFHSHDINAQQALISVDIDDFKPQHGKVYSVGLHPWHIGDDWLKKMEQLMVNGLYINLMMLQMLES